MNLSISTVCTPEFSWRDCFQEYAAAGYHAVELLMIPGWKHLTPGAVSANEVTAECEANALRLIALHAGAFDGTSPARLAESLDYLEQVADFAVECGVPLVNVNGGYVPPGTPQAERTEAVVRIAETLPEVIPLLTARGLRLTLENHFGFQLESAADYETALQFVAPDAPIGITVDTGHFTAARVDMVAFIQRWGQRIFHAHIKDHIGRDSVMLGQGETDNGAVLQALRAVGFTGYLSVEMEVHDRENAVRYVHESYPYMQSLMSKGETI